MNTGRLKAIAEHIAEEPTTFFMPTWVISTSDPTLQRWAGADYVAPECGTACCIAGHALRMAKEEGRRKGALPPNWNMTDWLELGAEELDLRLSEARRLFLPNNWPKEFEVAYHKALVAGDWQAAACVGAARIKHFIDTAGND